MTRKQFALHVIIAAAAFTVGFGIGGQFATWAHKQTARGHIRTNATVTLPDFSVRFVTNPETGVVENRWFVSNALTGEVFSDFYTVTNAAPR